MHTILDLGKLLLKLYINKNINWGPPKTKHHEPCFMGMAVGMNHGTFQVDKNWVIFDGDQRACLLGIIICYNEIPSDPSGYD